MRRNSLALLGVLAISAAFPVADVRNEYLPGTNTHFAMPAYRTRAEWEATRTQLRTQVLAAAGLVPMPEKRSLNPRIFGRIDRDAYSVEKVALETWPGYYLGGNLYQPLKPGRYPGVLIAHGHFSRGRLDNEPQTSDPRLAINLARQGYVAFTYDMVGYNDTRQTPHDFGGSRETLWSFSPLGLQLWNSIRAVDFLSTLPNVDRNRLAMTGASGGGTQTFLLGAVEDRISCLAPVVMVSASMQGGDVCENAPNLRLGTFNVEFAAMMAPKPLLLVSASGDWTRNTPTEEYPAIRGIYQLFDKPGRVENAHFQAQHNYNRASREAVYRFFARHLLRDPNPGRFSEQEAQVEPDENLLVFHHRPLPENALNYDQLFASWVEASRRQTDLVRAPVQLRALLANSLACEFPIKVASEANGNEILLTRPEKHDRVPGIYYPGRLNPVLIVNPGGSKEALKTGAIEKARAEGHPVLAIDAFQTGAAVAPRNRGPKHFLTFNRSDDANRVQDILTAISFLKSLQMGEVEVRSDGNAAVWSLFAAAVSPVPVRLNAKWNGFEGTDQDFINRFFVPGIQRAGGIQAALRLVQAGK